MNQEQTLDFPEGLYFNMSAQEYHSLNYFSRSLAELIHFDLKEAWHSYYNKKELKKTEQMELGELIHLAILESDKFDKTYLKPPQLDDFSNKIILNKNADFQEILIKNNISKTGTKEQLIQKVKPYIDPKKYIIWSEVLNSYENSLATENKKEISVYNYDIIKNIKENFNQTKQIKKFFTDGYPEVTIIWIDPNTNIKCKCRLDYLTATCIGELKTFSIKNKVSVEKTINNLIFYNYNMQYYIYFEALNIIKNKILKKQAKVYGKINNIWLEKFLNNQVLDFVFVFIRTQEPYQMQYRKTNPKQSYYDYGKMFWEKTIYQYKNCLEKYKRSEIWGYDEEGQELLDEWNDTENLDIESEEIVIAEESLV